MAEEKKKETPFFTTQKVKMYAPKGAKHHTEAGQETEIHPRQREKFLKLGYKDTKEEALESEAHPAIAVDQPVAKVKKVKAAEKEPEA